MPRTKTDVLLRDREQYTPIGLKSWNTESLKNEYSRLRAIANNRLKNFEGTEWADSEVFKQNFGKYKKLEGIKTDAELRRLTADVADFVTAKTSTVTGLKHKRSQTIKSLHESGYGFVNRKNYNDFVDFMEDMRSRAKGRQYDSERIAEMFNQMVNKRKLPPKEVEKNFDFYYENQEEINKLPKQQNGKPISSKKLKEMLNK